MYFHKMESKPGINVVDTKKAGMRFLGFEKIVLEKGGKIEKNLEDHEAFFVILGGKCSMKVDERSFENIGGRKNVFTGKPFAVYAPPNSRVLILTDNPGGVEIAVAKAKVDVNRHVEPYIITPSEIIEGKWGISNYSRKYHIIAVGDDHPAAKLMIGETFTPSGNWSTYPPHKHEKDDLPNEVFLEEIYYYKVDHPAGWGIARHYTYDGDINDLYLIKDDTVHLIPKGYHTVVSAPGFTVYYLWFLAGNHRTQAPVVDPNLAFIDQATKMLKNAEENLSF